MKTNTDAYPISVAVALPVYQIFSYHVPESLRSCVAVGKRVLIPFGRRTVTGYMIAAGMPDDSTDKDLKSIIDVLDEEPLFPVTMMPFLKWMADYYIHPIGEVIQNALPGGLTIRDFRTLDITSQGKAALTCERLRPLEADILRYLEDGTCSLNEICRILKKDVPASTVAAMRKRGWISQCRALRGGGVRPKTERFVRLMHSNAFSDAISAPRRKIIAALASQGDLSVKQLKSLVPTAPRLIGPLEKSGRVQVFTKAVYRDPFGESITPDRPQRLTAEQDVVVADVLDSLGKGFRSYLLAGVTGSGKTEVYLQLAARVINSGNSVLVLVPEIALISQMERRFRARFGECVAVLHSGLSVGERYDQWLRILNGAVSIAVGARSAVFAPFGRLGLIIVDEEHDTSYKQESGFKYNARDLAVVRAKQNDCVVLLGSATPSVQSYYNALGRKFKQVRLTRRVQQQPLPEIKVVDLGASRDNRGLWRFVSPELHRSMQETLARKEQVLLFLNRRGYAGFPVCADCGEPLRCKNCAISLTYHQAAHAYKCHYCGYTRAAVSTCKACGSARIKRLGVGTEKVAEAVKALFPDVCVARMDRDTTVRKGSLIKMLKRVGRREIDVLVGTQMVAKGHDFPNITLVGIICADLSLNFPDFRAGERTFQLLAQVAGRAGRGSVPGRVILQTYNPTHFSITAARTQDFEAFYRQEIGFRQSLGYPPFSRMVQLQISGRERRKTEKTAQLLGDACQTARQQSESYARSIEVLGPISSPLARIAGQHRWQILLKGLSVKPLHLMVSQIMAENKAVFNDRQVRVSVDVDPVHMM